MLKTIPLSETNFRPMIAKRYSKSNKLNDYLNEKGMATNVDLRELCANCKMPLAWHLSKQGENWKQINMCPEHQILIK